MIETCPSKIINIVATAAVEKKIRKMLKETGVNGYTLFDVRGDGESGYQGGQFESETNVLFMVVVSDSILEQLQERLKAFIQQGHHLMVFSSDVQVLTPSKFA